MAGNYVPCMHSASRDVGQQLRSRLEIALAKLKSDWFPQPNLRHETQDGDVNQEITSPSPQSPEMLIDDLLYTAQAHLNNNNQVSHVNKPEV